MKFGTSSFTYIDNVAEAKYGTPAWNERKYSYWSKLDGDGNITWGPDALLTPTGETQAADARTAWKTEVAHGVPLPTVFLSSLLRRALDTWKITFAESPEGEKPVLDYEYTNVRSTLVHLYPHPTYTFEAPFPEHDPLWEADVRETNEHVVERALTILDKAFQRSDTYISITAHSGFINGFLTAVGHLTFLCLLGG
ncbi:hypothetical protein QCA50_014489 [Cerrena zonata]|uniref:Phosphoglycerate mutase-like protein n=1 Tax=Cerrena zonata TaxID=2478898 RepID=A0AAW0FN55_9APHY